MLNKIGDRKDLALLILRVAVGVVFVAHGWMKYQTGMPGVATFFSSIGIMAPLFFAYVVTAVELLGGLGLITGVLARWSALALSVNMVVAIVMVKWSIGLIAPAGFGIPGAELDLALLGGTLAILLMGAGAYGVEQQVMGKEVV